jgi:methylated-DNA-[protein]-cysteine S-methyltransferase
MRQKQEYSYDIFRTRWGWFGVLGCDAGLVRTQLPETKKEDIKRQLLKGVEEAKPNKTPFTVLKSQILDYYQGKSVDFGDVKVHIAAFTSFQRKVLTNLRTVKYGQKISYVQLARLSGSPKAARAIGSVMAANPLPLIIPCHRVIKADGTVGMFSGAGGIKTKKRMLELENH